MAAIVQRSDNEITIQVTVRLGGTMLEMEDEIQKATNAVGRCATEEALRGFDTDGSAIKLGSIKWTARSMDPKEYQTPYGSVRLKRYVYQTSDIPHPIFSCGNFVLTECIKSSQVGCEQKENRPTIRNCLTPLA